MVQTIPVVITANVPPEVAQPVHAALDRPGALPGGTVDWAKVIDDATNVVHFVPLSKAPEGGPSPARPAGLAQLVFAVVAPFATNQDIISLEDLKARWSGSGAPLLVSEEAAVALGSVFGSLPSQIVPAAELATRLEEQPGALASCPSTGSTQATRCLRSTASIRSATSFNLRAILLPWR